MQPLPEIPASQYGHVVISAALLPAASWPPVIFCGKKVQIISGFHISYEPSVYILPLHASGSGLAIQGTVFLCGQGKRGIFYGTDVFRGKSRSCCNRGLSKALPVVRRKFSGKIPANKRNRCLCFHCHIRFYGDTGLQRQSPGNIHQTISESIFMFVMVQFMEQHIPQSGFAGIRKQMKRQVDAWSEKPHDDRGALKMQWCRQGYFR